MEKLLSNTTSKIIGYYYANESVTAPRLSYINQLVESIRTNTSMTDSNRNLNPNLHLPQPLNTAR